MHEAGHNVLFSDCRETLDRSKAGTTMSMVWSHIISWAQDGSHRVVASYSCSWRRQIGEGAQSIAW